MCHVNRPPEFEANGLLVLCDGLVRLTLMHEGEAKVVVSLGEMLLEPDGLLVLGDGLIQPALARQRFPKA